MVGTTQRPRTMVGDEDDGSLQCGQLYWGERRMEPTALITALLYLAVITK